MLTHYLLRAWPCGQWWTMHAGEDVRLKCRLKGLGCTNAEYVVPCIQMTNEQGDLSEAEVSDASGVAGNKVFRKDMWVRSSKGKSCTIKCRGIGPSPYLCQYQPT